VQKADSEWQVPKASAKKPHVVAASLFTQYNNGNKKQKNKKTDKMKSHTPMTQPKHATNNTKCSPDTPSHGLDRSARLLG
jgi:hypothetical protein